MYSERNIRTVVEDVTGQLLASRELELVVEALPRSLGLTEHLLAAAAAGARSGRFSANACFALKAAAILLEAGRIKDGNHADDSEITAQALDLFERHGEREMGLRLLDDPHDFLRWFVLGCNQLKVFRRTSALDLLRMHRKHIVSDLERSIRRSYQVLLDAGW